MAPPPKLVLMIPLPRGWGWIFLGAQTVGLNISVQCYNPYKLAFSKMNFLGWFTPVKRKKVKKG
jgi:hypothetical protein